MPQLYIAPFLDFLRQEPYALRIKGTPWGFFINSISSGVIEDGGIFYINLHLFTPEKIHHISENEVLLNIGKIYYRFQKRENEVFLTITESSTGKNGAIKAKVLPEMALKKLILELPIEWKEWCPQKEWGKTTKLVKEYTTEFIKKRANDNMMSVFEYVLKNRMAYWVSETTLYRSYRSIKHRLELNKLPLDHLKKAIGKCRYTHLVEEFFTLLI